MGRTSASCKVFSKARKLVSDQLNVVCVFMTLQRRDGCVDLGCSRSCLSATVSPFV